MAEMGKDRVEGNVFRQDTGSWKSSAKDIGP